MIVSRTPTSSENCVSSSISRSSFILSLSNSSPIIRLCPTTAEYISNIKSVTEMSSWAYRGLQMYRSKKQTIGCKLCSSRPLRAACSPSLWISSSIMLTINTGRGGPSKTASKAFEYWKLFNNLSYGCKRAFLFDSTTTSDYNK